MCSELSRLYHYRYKKLIWHKKIHKNSIRCHNNARDVYGGSGDNRITLPAHIYICICTIDSIRTNTLKRILKLPHNMAKVRKWWRRRKITRNVKCSTENVCIFISTIAAINACMWTWTVFLLFSIYQWYGTKINGNL